MKKKILVAAAAAALLVTVSCDKVEKTIFEGTTTTTSATGGGPPHHSGESCIECHTTWNIQQLHDASSTEYNSDCTLCHGDMSSETSLSASVPAIHPKMIPYVISAAGQTTTNGAVCRYCHQTVNYLDGSSANLRKHVAASNCHACHTLAGPGKQLYQ